MHTAFSTSMPILPKKGAQPCSKCKGRSLMTLDDILAVADPVMPVLVIEHPAHALW